jgi:hypothetical protein
LAGRTLSEAVNNYIAPLAEALLCITQRRLSRPPSRGLRLNTPYEANLADMDPVALRGQVPLTFSAGQNYEILELDEGDQRWRYAIRTSAYFYAIATAEGRSILEFHWQPDAKPARDEEKVITIPHMHVGPAVTAGQTVIRPDSFHKAHIPTGRVTLQSMVRLLIEELGIEPLNAKWNDILTASETNLSDLENR